jgi:mono/diheme cytochrome c family protein
VDALRAERAQGQPPPAEGQPPADPLAGVDLQAIAMERAVARGKHLVQARYVCVECHGKDFGGGTMIDDPAIGKLFGPNLTARGVTASFTTADWDRAVRHGALHDGKVSFMPTEDFKAMTDRELSDILAYIRTQPPVDRTMPARELGPLGTILVALGQVRPGADSVADHQAAHAVMPPEEAPTPEFGEHLAHICTGCHGPDLSGGKIPGGPPDWPAASNLTPAALKDWTFESFVTLMRTGVRPDGTKVQQPMANMPTYANNMTETELRALWAYMQSVPAKETRR